jgi:hypothetical protein
VANPRGARSVGELVHQGKADARPFADTVRHFGESSTVVDAYVRFGIQFSSAVIQDASSLEDLDSYASLPADRAGAVWMDNTTLYTAVTLLSDENLAYMTPLTVWDLVTFFRAVVCYQHIYHHENSSVDDRHINGVLGEEVLRAIPLPLRPAYPPPDKWDGAHRFMCEVWDAAHSRIGNLALAKGLPTLDGQELAALRQSWALALQRDDLEIEDLVNASDASRRWTSPSNMLLREMVDTTKVDVTITSLDPNERFRRLAETSPIRNRSQRRRLGELLTDLNLRGYVNQRLADFFQLPYSPAAARIPFRRHLYDRAVAVHQNLHTIDALEERYGELARGVRLQLPILLAVGLHDARSPDDLWHSLARQRERAGKFRARRTELDSALGRRDRKEISAVSKALRTDVDTLGTVLGGASAAGTLSILEEVAKGSIDSVALSVAAAEAASKRLVSSSLSARLFWRLRRPHLYYLNNLVDEAQHLTESLPDFARIWKIPEREQALFAARFMSMSRLLSSD